MSAKVGLHPYKDAINFIRALAAEGQPPAPYHLPPNYERHVIKEGRIPEAFRQVFIGELQRLIAQYKRDCKTHVPDKMVIKRLNSLIKSIDNVVDTLTSIEDALAVPTSLEAKMQWALMGQATSEERKRRKQKSLYQPFEWFNTEQQKLRESLLKYRETASIVKKWFSRQARRPKDINYFYVLQLLALYLSCVADAMPKINEDDPFCRVVGFFFESVGHPLENGGSSYIGPAISQFETLVEGPFVK